MHDIEALARQAWASGDPPSCVCPIIQDALLELGFSLLTEDETVDLIRDLVGANGAERQGNRRWILMCRMENIMAT
jgi:hypothetical protein